MCQMKNFHFIVVEGFRNLTTIKSIVKICTVMY